MGEGDPTVEGEAYLLSLIANDFNKKDEVKLTAGSTRNDELPENTEELSPDVI